MGALLGASVLSGSGLYHTSARIAALAETPAWAKSAARCCRRERAQFLAMHAIGDEERVEARRVRALDVGGKTVADGKRAPISRPAAARARANVIS